LGGKIELECSQLSEHKTNLLLVCLALEFRFDGGKNTFKIRVMTSIASIQ